MKSQVLTHPYPPNLSVHPLVTRWSLRLRPFQLFCRWDTGICATRRLQVSSSPSPVRQVGNQHAGCKRIWHCKATGVGIIINQLYKPIANNFSRVNLIQVTWLPFFALVFTLWDTTVVVWLHLRGVLELSTATSHGVSISHMVYKSFWEWETG